MEKIISLLHHKMNNNHYRQQILHHNLNKIHTRNRVIPYLNLAYLKDPICDQCSGLFLRKMDGLLSKQLTIGSMGDIIKSQDTIQSEFYEEYEKWLKKK
jgi:hypothetical protein